MQEQVFKKKPISLSMRRCEQDLFLNLSGAILIAVGAVQAFAQSKDPSSDVARSSEIQAIDNIPPESFPTQLLGNKAHFRFADSTNHDIPGNTARWERHLTSQPIHSDHVFRIAALTPAELRNILRKGIIPSGRIFDADKAKRTTFDRVFTSREPGHSVWQAMYTGFSRDENEKKYIVLMEINKSHPGVQAIGGIAANNPTDDGPNLVFDYIYPDQIKKLYFADPQTTNGDFPFREYTPQKIRQIFGIKDSDIKPEPPQMESVTLPDPLLRDVPGTHNNPNTLSMKYSESSRYLRANSTTPDSMMQSIISDSARALSERRLFYENARERQEFYLEPELDKHLQFSEYQDRFNKWYPTRFSTSGMSFTRMNPHFPLKDRALLIRRQEAVREFVNRPNLSSEFNDLISKLRMAANGLMRKTPDFSKEIAGFGDQASELLFTLMQKSKSYPHESIFAMDERHDDWLGLIRLIRAHSPEGSLSRPIADRLTAQLAHFANSLEATDSAYLREVGHSIWQSIQDLRALAGKTPTNADRESFFYAQFLKLMGALQDTDILIALGHMARSPEGWKFPKIPEPGAPAVTRLNDAHHSAVLSKVGMEKSVSNSFAMGGENDPRVYVLKGPNKRGKSTFLQTIAGSDIQTMMGSPSPVAEGTVLAPFNIQTAMLHEGSVKDAESNFSNNSKAILKAVRRARESSPSILLIDEPYIGTNPSLTDRILNAVIKRLVHEPFTTIIVTHSDQIQKEVASLPGVQIIHNTEGFKIKPGPATDYSGETIKLLHDQGYDDVFPGITDEIARSSCSVLFEQRLNKLLDHR